MLVTAAVALDAQESVFQKSALQVLLELLTNELGKMTTRTLDLLQEARVMLGDNGVKGGLLRPVAVIGRGSGNCRRNKHQP